MYRTFVDNTIKEFQYNHEEELNRFNEGICLMNSSYCMIPNFYLAGYNKKNNNVFSKALCGEHVGEIEPTYDYEEYDECID